MLSEVTGYFQWCSERKEGNPKLQNTHIPASSNHGFNENTNLPETNLTPENQWGWKMNFFLVPSLFSGANC